MQQAGEPHTFNRICLAIALVWLLVTIPLGLIRYPTMPDFGQFYVGGLIARLGEWSSLYPIPVLNSLDNAGLNIHSFAKPGWRALCLQHGVPDYTHFILPPPSALLFIPLSFLSYQQAYWTWILILTFCVWGVAWTSGQIARTLFGTPTRVEGVLALLIAFSPMTARSIRIANVSPPLALVIGFTLLSLLRGTHHFRSAGALLLGATLKYASLVLAPLLIAMRRWKTLFHLAALGMLLLAVTLALTGPQVFVEFYQRILPTLARPSWYHGNQSLSGMLSRLFGRPLHPRLVFLLSTLRISTLGIILAQLLTVRPSHWRAPENVLAATALLLSWLFIFSPIAWEHWPIFFCPLWGWLIWEARGGEWRRILAYAGIALLYFPAGILQVHGFFYFPILLPEPYNSWQLGGVVLVFALATWRLSNPLLSREPSSEPSTVQKVHEMR